MDLVNEPELWQEHYDEGVEFIVAAIGIHHDIASRSMTG